jgi:hypothetical protein
MDLPTANGIVLECPAENASPLVTSRRMAMEQLNKWSRECGVLSRGAVKFVIGENGKVRCIANHFIPANKHILHVPFKMDLSFTSLKCELVSNRAWVGWADLKSRISQFEESFQWNPYNYDQKDYFSKNAQLAICIVGVLHKLDTIALKQQQQHVSSHDAEDTSFILQTFSHYWKSLPYDIGNILYNWTPLELGCLYGSSFANSLSDAKRYGEEFFFQVILPFTQDHPDIFGTKITVEQYFYINSIILTQSFSTGKKEKSALLPVIDLVAGKPNEMHNCTLENCAIQKEVNGEFVKFHVLESYCDIHAGDEIFIEYAQVGNSDYLMTYNYIPLDPEIIMNNQKSNVHLDLAEFLETELLRMHPNAPKVRTLKRQHIYGFFNLPKTLPISMEDLFSSEYSCIPSIRQVIIFLQFDEQEAQKAIKTSRIRSQLNPTQLHFLFHKFFKFIECSFEKLPAGLFRSLVTNRLPHSVVNLVSQYGNNEQLYYALNSLLTASLTPATLLTVSLQSIQMIEKGMALPPLLMKSSGVDEKKKESSSSTSTRGRSDSGYGSDSTPSKNNAPEGETNGPEGSTSGSSSSKKKNKHKKKGSSGSSDAAKAAGDSAANISTEQRSDSDSEDAYPDDDSLYSDIPLTPNMRSAIYLQMSERLIIEIMINRFIHLFPENFHELGFSLLHDYLVSSEIGHILGEICRPMMMSKNLHCLVCGSTTNVSKCSRCRKAYYCSAACQKEHWQYHRHVCKPFNAPQQQQLQAPAAPAQQQPVQPTTTATAPAPASTKNTNPTAPVTPSTTKTAQNAASNPAKSSPPPPPTPPATVGTATVVPPPAPPSTATNPSNTTKKAAASNQTPTTETKKDTTKVSKENTSKATTSQPKAGTTPSKSKTKEK